MSKRRKLPSTEACIYCGSTAPRKSREHVIPQALGTFKDNWTLTWVCHESEREADHEGGARRAEEAVRRWQRRGELLCGIRKGRVGSGHASRDW